MLPEPAPADFFANPHGLYPIVTFPEIHNRSIHECNNLSPALDSVLIKNHQATGVLTLVNSRQRVVMGSGTFLNSHLFLTSGHVLRDAFQTQSQMQGNLVVEVFNHPEISNNPHSQIWDSRYSSIEISQNVRYIETPHLDFALIHFDQSVHAINQNWPILDIEYEPHGEYIMIHHANDGIKKISTGQAGGGGDYYQFRGEIRIAGGPAASGAPIFNSHGHLVAIARSRDEQFLSLRNFIFIEEILKYEFTHFDTSWIYQHVNLTPAATEIYRQFVYATRIQTLQAAVPDLNASFIFNAWGEILEGRDKQVKVKAADQTVLVFDIQPGNKFTFPKSFTKGLFNDALELLDHFILSNKFAEIWIEGSQATLIEGKSVRLDRQPSYANSPTANIQIQINDGYFKQGEATTIAHVLISKAFKKISQTQENQTFVLQYLAESLRLSLTATLGSSKAFGQTYRLNRKDSKGNIIAA